MVDPAPVTPSPSTGLVFRIVAELAAAAMTVFVLVAFAAPMLMDIRSNLAFWTGVACWPLAVLVGLVAAAWARRDLRALRRLRGGPVRLSGPD